MLGGVVVDGEQLLEVGRDPMSQRQRASRQPLADCGVHRCQARGSGVLQGIRLQEGATAPVGEVIAVIGGEGEAAPAVEEKADEKKPDAAEKETEQPAETVGQKKAAPVAEDADSESASEPEPEEERAARPEGGAPAPEERDNGRGEGRIKASPLARRLAEEQGVELASVEGSGPGGRITKRDIEAAAQGGPKAAAPEAPVQTPAAPRIPAGQDSEEVPVTQMRKTIAKRLAQSIGPIPTFYLTIECDMTRLQELRERTNRRLEKEGGKTSINDFLIKALAAALRAHPEVNASWGENVIVRHHRVHVGRVAQLAEQVFPGSADIQPVELS